MRSATELKQIFQEGWNTPARVDNYVRNVAEAEFAEGECAQAWRQTLEAVLSAADRLKILDVGTGPGVFAGLYAQNGPRMRRPGLLRQNASWRAPAGRKHAVGLLLCLRRCRRPAVSRRYVRRGVQPPLALQPAASRSGRARVDARLEAGRQDDPDRGGPQGVPRTIVRRLTLGMRRILGWCDDAFLAGPTAWLEGESRLPESRVRVSAISS